jgi:GTPase-associated protein 1
MAYAQAYYTSCEVGLSGFAGFQFNAATAGLSPQLLREVEALTSYEPPRSLGHHPTPDEIADCPVNLVYRSEPTAILANVRYVGADASGRLGNYFAHALIAQPGPDGFDQVLPIELWGSAFWAGAPVRDRELPALAALPGPAPGEGLNRAGVDEFLAGRQHSEQLAALVSAAQEAVLGRGRSIVVIESDTDAAAHWIGAIAFLLPPPLARRMSFATYHHRPEYSDTHVIATLPESDFALDDAVAGSYIVFDPASGRVGDVTADPAATLLVQAGTVRAGRLFQRAAQFLAEGAHALSQWHPALVAAAALDGAPVSAADLDLLSQWLQTDVELPAADRTALREIAVARGVEALRAAPAHAVLTVLDRCANLDIELPEPTLRAYGEHTLGPELVRGDSPVALAAAGRHGALLDGVLSHLSSVVEQQPEAVARAFTAGLGELVDDPALPPELQQPAAVARARRDAERAAEPEPPQPGGRTPASLRRLVQRINGRGR